MSTYTSRLLLNFAANVATVTLPGASFSIDSTILDLY